MRNLSSKSNKTSERKEEKKRVKNGELKRAAGAMLIAMGSLFGCFSGSATAGETWKLHPAFDAYPVKIIDTENTTYFTAFQQYYNSGRISYKIPYVTMFYYDKMNPAGGVKPLAQKCDLSGSNVYLSEYNPDGGYLFVIYTDGKADIIEDSGTVRSTSALSSVTYPGSNIINAMTFAGTDIWVATGCGYVIIDGLTGDQKFSANLQQNISNIGKVGDKVVAFSGGTAYEADANNLPRKFSEFTQIVISGSGYSTNIVSSEGALVSPQVLMPLENGYFAFVAPKATTGTYSLNVVNYDGENWQYRLVNDLWLPSTAASRKAANIFEGNFIRNKNGYLMWTGGNLHQLNYDKGGDSANFDKSYAANKSLTIAGSWDMTNVWTYQDRGRLLRAEVNASGNPIWESEDEALRPEAPATFIATDLCYSSQYGVVAVNYGYSFQFTYLAASTPLLVSNYKLGKWNVPAPIYHTPTSAEENETYAKLYSTYNYRYPVSDPTGVSVDPTNPNYVWFGSTFSGFAGLNLSTPKADPLHFGSAEDPLATYPNFKTVLPNCSYWKGWASATPPSFDKAGNLWVAYNNIDQGRTGGDVIQLMCLTPSDRLEMLRTNDISKCPDFKTIDVPYSAPLMAAAQKLYALTSQSNNNKLLIYYPYGYGRFIVVYDHKGTIEDTSDDESKKFLYVRDQYGAEWPISYNYAWAEDPQSGEVWEASCTQLVSFNPNDEATDDVIPGKVLEVQNGGAKINPFSNVMVNGIAFDEYNRMWVTTTGYGVWCISADRTEVVAHYTTGNSKLPSDTGYGLVWNPESKSMMISTEAGLVEVWPDLYGVSTAMDDAPYIYPRAVTPDYSGSVTMRQLLAYGMIAVKDINGKTVRTLNADADGSLAWDLLDDNGSPVATGTYIISSQEDAFSDVEIIVMR